MCGQPTRPLVSDGQPLLGVNSFLPVMRIATRDVLLSPRVFADPVDINTHNSGGEKESNGMRMGWRIRELLGRLSFALLLVVPVSDARAQGIHTTHGFQPQFATGSENAQPAGSGAVRIPPAARDTATAHAVIEQGMQFERDERWLDALSFYEKALRENPSAPELELRRTLASIHCDLERRQADPSYHTLANRVPESEAIDMFNEIALKVQTHYVDSPDWQKLTWRGTANLDVAVTKRPFREAHLPGVTDEQINAFRHRLRDDVNRRPVRSRPEARELVVYTARLAAQDLGLPPAVSVLEYCCGAISSLDQYSTYLSGGQLDDVYSQIEGNFVGLGIELKADPDALRIVKVIPGGPAEQAGMQAGEVIIGVDGQSTAAISTDAAADLLKGVEGSVVEVALRGDDANSRVVRVTRRRVDVPCVEDVKIVDSVNGIGYFRLTSFQKTTSRDVDEALWRLHRQGMRGLIIDVRGNPGGLLTASVEVADKFLTDGTIVSTRGRSPRETFDYKAHRGGTWRVPLLVLIDRDTASASEIFAGAIHDHERGVVLGERSYGKGSVQGIFPLNSSRAGVRLTTAKFFSPSGQAISKVGVSPHRTIHQAAKPNTDDVAVSSSADSQADPVMAAAVETARQLAVAQR